MAGDPLEFSIRVQVLAGTWETIGVDRYLGVSVEGLQLSSNAFGSDTCSFTLRRDPAAVHPDLLAWTPVEVSVAGRMVWDGRVKETPAQEGADFSLSVQCEGWQYHLDDDVYQSTYVQTRLSDWQDQRSFPAADLTSFVAAPSIQAGGTLSLTWPVDQAANGRAAVVYDAGPGAGIIRVVFGWSITAGAANRAWYIAGSQMPYADSTAAETQLVYTATPATGSLTAYQFSSPVRYVFVIHDANSHTPTLDETLTINSALLVTSTAYEASNTSILKADQVVKDALTQATVLLSSDVSNVSAGTFSIPEFGMSDYQTPRSVITAVNAYENFETKMMLRKRFAFRARASAPIYEIGEWSGADFADASTNSGDDIFNKVIVQGTGPDGQSLTTIRTAGQQPLASPATIVSSPAATNPGFEVNTTGWTAPAGSTITRDTTVFDTGVASGRWDTPTAVAPGLTGTFTGTFLKGVTYRIDVRLRTTVLGSPLFVRMYLGAAWTNVVVSSTFGTGSLTVTPAADFTASVGFYTVGSGTAASVWVDNVTVSRVTPTLPDRWGFNHSMVLPVSAGLTIPSSQRIGDLYLAAHKTTPFRGAFNALPGGVRRVQGGASPHPAALLADTGQLVRVMKVDPDTGAWGRSGTIAAVSYNHESLTASVSLDENRAGFDTLLSRLAVVTGQRQT